LGINPPSGKNELAEILATLEKFRTVRLDERGRIYIPKTIREKLQIKLGDKVYIKIENNHFAVYTGNAIKKQ
jgi:AbrB family looped-hinge helix DNA binding protein